MPIFLQILRLIFFHPRDPFGKSNFDFLSCSRDDFLFALVQRRQVFDARLRAENLNSWPMFKFRDSVEGLILAAAEANARLTSGMLSPNELSRRIDLAIGLKGRGTTGAENFKEYLRLVIMPRDPPFLVLGPEYFDRHVGLCEAYAVHKFNRMGAWPPAAWLGKRLSPDDASQAYALAKLTPLMLLGDELWSYSSPPEIWKHMMGRAGVVLIRDGRIISDVLTLMN